MSKTGIGCLAVVGVAVLMIIIVIASLIGVWNSLNYKFQNANAGASKYSAALNVSTAKIQGVWGMSERYLQHESVTFQGVAQARSGFLRAKEAFEQARAGGSSSTLDLTKIAMVAQAAFAELARQGGLSINVQIEAYPQLRGAETTEKAMRTMEEGTNEIKTALDDWITTIRDYNAYRGSFWPNVWGSMMGRFPSKLEYYEGDVKKLEIETLNPAKRPVAPAPAGVATP